MAEYMNNMPDAALDWDSEVTNEQREFVLLPAGDYLFTVQSFERARYEGSAKLPPCSMAKLTITHPWRRQRRNHRHPPPVPAHQDPGPAGRLF